MRNRRFAIVALCLAAGLLLMLAALVANPIGAATPTPVVDADMMEWPDRTETIVATFPVSTAVSGPVYLNGMAIVGYVMPSTWDAADLTFQASLDDTTYNNVYLDDDNEHVVQASASRYIVALPGEMRGVRWLMVRSGTAASPVNQENGTTAQTLTIVVMPTD